MKTHQHSPIVDNEDVVAGSPPPTPSQVDDPSQMGGQTVEDVISAEIHKTAHPNPPSYQTPNPPSQTSFALGVAKEILNDFLDEDQQIFAAAGLVTALILLFWRRMSHQITRRTAAKVIETLRAEGVI